MDEEKVLFQIIKTGSLKDDGYSMDMRVYKENLGSDVEYLAMLQILRSAVKVMSNTMEIRLHSTWCDYSKGDGGNGDKEESNP